MRWVRSWRWSNEPILGEDQSPVGLELTLEIQTQEQLAPVRDKIPQKQKGRQGMAKEKQPGKARPVKPGVSWAAPLLTDS